eukprot:m.181659 g.181659  ORF g.181659 m.181659 type:complete len:187 (+) comp53473_c0_seq5:177-737(+)
MEWFLQQQVDCDCVDTAGRTAVVLAAVWNSAGCTRLLLAAGADTARTDRYQKTALDYAIQRERKEIIALLQDHERLLVAQQNIKPAFRGPVLDIVEALEAGTTESVVHNLLLDEQIMGSEIEFVEPVGQKESVAQQPDMEGATAVTGRAETTTLLEYGQQTQQQHPSTTALLMNLSLTELDFAMSD